MKKNFKKLLTFSYVIDDCLLLIGLRIKWKLSTFETLVKFGFKGLFRYVDESNSNDLYFKN